MRQVDEIPDSARGVLADAVVTLAMKIGPDERTLARLEEAWNASPDPLDIPPGVLAAIFALSLYGTATVEKRMAMQGWDNREAMLRCLLNGFLAGYQAATEGPLW